MTVADSAPAVRAPSPGPLAGRPSTAYLVEAAPPDRRGFVASWQIASQGHAALPAGIVATGLTLLVGASAMAAWGWRVMFALGLLVVPVGLVIRSHLPETAGVPAFLAPARARRGGGLRRHLPALGALLGGQRENSQRSGVL